MVDCGNMTVAGAVEMAEAVAAAVVILSRRLVWLVSTPSIGSWLGQVLLPPLLYMVVAVGCEDEIGVVLGSCWY